MTGWAINRGISVLTRGEWTANVWVSRKVDVGPKAKFEWGVGKTNTGIVERSGYAETAQRAEKAAEAALTVLEMKARKP